MGSLAALAVLFGAVLPAPEETGCSTSVPAGVYADAMLPAHLAAAAVIGAGLAGLARARGESRRRVRALWAAAGAVVVLVAWPRAFETVAAVAMLASLVAGPPLLLVLVLRTALALRSGGAEAWRRHAITAEVAGWAALVAGIPAAYGWNHLNAASLFCF